MTDKFYVYVHKRADDNLPFYVGKGKNKRAWSFDGRNPFWRRTQKKHGVIVEIVFEDLTEEDAFQCEIDTILEFKYFGYPLTNLTVGGEGVCGYERTAEQNEKAALARKNSPKWWEGNRRAAEKIRGRKLSEEHRKNISLGNLGKVVSGETKQKLSEAKKSCPKALAHIRGLVEKQKDKKIHTFYCISGEVFSGTREEFSNYTNTEPKNVNKLFAKKNPRLSTNNWSLSPITIEIPEKKALICPQKANGNVDKNVYTFCHIIGDNFTGTRKEFSDYSQISLVSLAGLFCKNPRRSVYGWSLSERQSTTATKI